jgi:hypothetical protein
MPGSYRGREDKSASKVATVIDVAVQRHHLGGVLKEPFHARSKGPKLRKIA